jgi:prepilin-type N-terminal cleavage/methylation domain-containing protein
MGTSIRARRGVTLVEVILVIGIMGILVGLLLVAVQRTRESAALLQNKNNLRQIILAVHQVAGENEGNIEPLMRTSMKGLTSVDPDYSLFYRLTPYLHGPQVMPTDLSTAAWNEYFSPNVKVYRNLADPSWDYDPAEANVPGKCSYALNMFATDGSVHLPASLPDGTSTTVAFADKYAVKGSPNSTLSQTVNLYTQVWGPYNDEIYGDRRATFADRGWEDVLPVTDIATATTRPSVAGKTFQVHPRPENVDPSIPQTPHRAGLTVAMFDGSVQTLSPSVSESVFWALVTPMGGEAVNAD